MTGKTSPLDPRTIKRFFLFMQLLSLQTLRGLADRTNLPFGFVRSSVPLGDLLNSPNVVVSTVTIRKCNDLIKIITVDITMKIIVKSLSF